VRGGVRYPSDVGSYLETDRLTFRRFTADDVDLLSALDGDPAVMRYLTGGKPTPRERISGEILPWILEVYARHPRFGTFATHTTATGEFIGWFELRPKDGDERDVELGYRLRRAAWGHGYATEGARALVRKAFIELQVERVWAETMSVNTPSRKVMERVGLTYLRTFHVRFDDPIDGTEHGEVEYELRRADWERAVTA
jgi:RimJ/RimL family protein N-acetyltransferase